MDIIEKNVVKLNETCRVCLRKEEDMICISKDTTEVINLISLLAVVSDCDIEINSELPNFICKQCEIHLYIFNTLKQQIDRTNEILKVCFDTNNFAETPVSLKNEVTVNLEEIAPAIELFEKDNNETILNVSNINKVQEQKSDIIDLTDESDDLNNKSNSITTNKQPKQPVKNSYVKNLTNNVFDSLKGSPVTMPKKKALAPNVIKLQMELLKNFCTECCYGFTDRSCLFNHMKLVHKKVVSSWCIICNTVSDHIKSHNYNYHGTCHICAQTFHKDTRILDVLDHLYGHFSEERVRCEQCDVPCISPTHLNIHITLCHNGKVWSKNNCLLCDFKGSHSSELYMHMSRSHPEFKSKWCKICNMLTDSYAEHFKTHLTCKYCKESFKKTCEVQAHLPRCPESNELITNNSSNQLNEIEIETTQNTSMENNLREDDINLIERDEHYETFLNNSEFSLPEEDFSDKFVLIGQEIRDEIFTDNRESFKTSFDNSVIDTSNEHELLFQALTSVGNKNQTLPIVNDNIVAKIPRKRKKKTKMNDFYFDMTEFLLTKENRINNELNPVGEISEDGTIAILTEFIQVNSAKKAKEDEKMFHRELTRIENKMKMEEKSLNSLIISQRLIYDNEIIKGAIERVTQLREMTKQCNLCDFVGGRRALPMHMNRQHKFFNFCYDCNGKIEDRKHWQQHYIFCEFCNSRFRNASDAITHLLEHSDTNNQPSECEICKKVFNSASKLNEHVKKMHSVSNMVQCPYCPKELRYSMSMKAHIENKHKPIYCLECKRRFFTDEECESHFCYEEEETPIVNFCKKCNRRVLNLSQHNEKFHNMLGRTRTRTTYKPPPPALCNICGKQISDNHKLKEHMRIHTGEKPYKCTYCDRRYRLRVELVCHLASHTNKSEFQCSLCDLKFRSSSLRYAHKRRVHYNIRNYYQCTLCERKFATNTLLKRHLEKVHQVILENRAPEVVTSAPPKKKMKKSLNYDHECVICGKNFTFLSFLTQHMKTHSDERSYQCPHCSFAFKQRTVLWTHLQTHSAEKPFKCSKCVFASKCSYDLAKHLQKKHDVPVLSRDDEAAKCSFCEKRFSAVDIRKAHERLRHPYLVKSEVENIENSTYFV